MGIGGLIAALGLILAVLSIFWGKLDDVHYKAKKHFKLDEKKVIDTREDDKYGPKNN